MAASASRNVTRRRLDIRIGSNIYGGIRDQRIPSRTGDTATPTAARCHAVTLRISFRLRCTFRSRRVRCLTPMPFDSRFVNQRRV